MSGFNNATVAGNVGGAPEIRSLPDGSRVANFSVATSDQWRDKASGEKRERTEWHRVVVWNENIVAVVEKWVGKGDKVLVSGKLRTRKWQASDGGDRYTTEIHLERFGGTLSLLGGTARRDDPAADAPPPSPPSPPTNVFDDDIPF